MVSSRITVLAVAGAFALGAIGSTAFGDDDEPGWNDLSGVQLAQDDDHRDDRDDNAAKNRIDGARDDDVVDVEPRDEDDDRGDGGNTNSGGPNDGAGDNTGTGGDSAAASASAPVAAPAPVPAPAPVYSGGGSDYGDS